MGEPAELGVSGGVPVQRARSMREVCQAGPAGRWGELWRAPWMGGFPARAVLGRHANPGTRRNGEVADSLGPTRGHGLSRETVSHSPFRREGLCPRLVTLLAFAR